MDFFHLIDPDFTKYFLLSMNAVFILITAILFVALIVHKVHVERYEIRLTRLENEFKDLLSKKVASQDVVIGKPGTEIEYEALGNAIINMLSGSDKPTACYLRTICRRLDLDIYNQQRAHSRSWVKRYQAIEKLGFLKLEGLEPFYSSILEKEKNLHVITKTIWALSLIADVDDIDKINIFLTDSLFASSKFKEYIYTNIIKAFIEREEEDKFLRLLNSWEGSSKMPVLLKKDVISACGVAKLESSKDSIVRYYMRFHNNPDMKIACIRALQRIGDSSVYPIIKSALKDDDWRVRAVAAKDAEVYSEAIVDSLESVLEDKSYYVRINAAQALFKLGDKGIAALTRFTCSDDRFARDMAHYMLSR